MHRQIATITGVILLSGAILSCNSSHRKSSDVPAENAVALREFNFFNADSAYNNVSRQVAFGPRVPGTAAHDACRDWLVEELRRFDADTVIVQNGSVVAYNGDVLPISNIIASYAGEENDRILLVAHYDTRPWADKETDSELRAKPIPGANDGGSGVGVLLEIARNLNLRKPPVGVDILLVDAEDYGSNSGFTNSPETWCLGTQYWLKNMVPYNLGNLPRFGILLDMVGGRDARFHIEAFANRYASVPTAKVWNEAKALGLNGIFINQVGGAVTDDHVFLTEAGIPTTNIIECLNPVTSGFPPSWHTHADNMDQIDRASLEAVGRTVMSVLYREKPSVHNL